jgi:hypothetical protein
MTTSARSLVLFVAVLLVLGAGGALLRRQQVDARCRPLRERLAGLPAFADARLDAARSGLTSEWETACSAADEKSSACFAQRLDALERTGSVVKPDTHPLVLTTLVGRLEGCAVNARPHDAEVERLALEADLLRMQGRPAAEAAARTALARAQSLPGVDDAQPRLVLAQVLRARGELDEARAMLAPLEALPADDEESRRRLALEQALLASARGDFALAEQKLAAARGEERSASRDEKSNAGAHAALEAGVRAQLRLAQGRPADALEASDAALRWADAYDPVSAIELRALRTTAFLQLGRDNRALDEATRVVNAREDLLGHRHALTIQARVTLGGAQARCGLVRQAVEALTSALDDLRANQDVAPISAAAAMNSLGLALAMGGQPGEALNASLSADELVKSLVGPKHRYAALSARVAAERYFDAGRDDEAFAAIDSAVALAEAAAGAQHRDTLEARARRAWMRARRGQPDDAGDARFVLDALAAHPDVGEAPLVLVRLAVASTSGATDAQRAEALDVARKVRGTYHPDVARALVLQKKAGDARAAAILAEQLEKLEVSEDAL